MRSEKEIKDRLEKLIKLEQQEVKDIESGEYDVLSCIERANVLQCERQMLEWVLNEI